jgi:uncharacterized membrane protein
MKTRHALLLTVALFLVGSIIRFDLAGTVVPLICFVVLGTSVWAALDSANLKLKDYRASILYSPIVVFIACVLFWVIAFPWYLSVRYQVQRGAALC